MRRRGRSRSTTRANSAGAEPGDTILFDNNGKHRGAVFEVGERQIVQIRAWSDQVAQTTSGLRALLSSPVLYSLFQNVLGARRSREELVKAYVRPWPGCAVLDIGCGPGDMLDFLPDVRYHGFDESEAYIESARLRFGNRGTFVAERVSEASLRADDRFDIVLALGILHHLEDEEALDLFELAGRLLGKGGRLVTVDPAFVNGQNPIARWLISQDRGRRVRSPEAYEQLARRVFPDVEACVRHDLTRIPYTHAIMVCTGAMR